MKKKVTKFIFCSGTKYTEIENFSKNFFMIIYFCETINNKDRVSKIQVSIELMSFQREGLAVILELKITGGHVGILGKKILVEFLLENQRYNFLKGPIEHYRYFYGREYLARPMRSTE